MDSDLAVRLERAKAGDGNAFDELLDRLARHHLLALTLYYHLDLPIEEVEMDA